MTDVTFEYVNKEARRVYLSGDLNGWSRDADPMRRDAAGVWRLTRSVDDRLWQRYRFIVDDVTTRDPNNPNYVMGWEQAYAALVSLLPGRVPAPSVAQASAANVVTFEYHDPGAKKVCLAGDFNSWSRTADPLVLGRDGVWRIQKEFLVPGWLQYVFVVDGREMPDPLNSCQASPKNPAGAPISLLRVPSRGPLQGAIQEIHTVLERNTPQEGNAAERERALRRLDDILQSPLARGDSDIVDLYIARLSKAVQEIEESSIPDGARVWHIYNHGYVVSTAGLTFAIDVITCRTWYWWNQIPAEMVSRLARTLDFLLISHDHPDHYDPELVREMTRLGKKVIMPKWMAGKGVVGMKGGESRPICGADLTAYAADHGPYANCPHLYYRVTDPRGLVILHTADHNYTRGVTASPRPDILILKCGRVDPGFSVREAVASVLEKVSSTAVLAGHLAEIGHLPNGGREPYAVALEALNGATRSWAVQTWGEVYNFRK